MAHRYAYLDSPLPIGFAHRGGADAGDENTAAAFARAVAMGYRYIETDTRATADGVAVVFHDDDLERLTGARGQIRDLRWSDLASLRVNGAEVVPRLADVLGAWPEIRFNIDAKSDEAVAPTIAAVRRTGAQDRVLLASFSDQRLATMRREMGPRVATSMGMREIAWLWSAAKAGVRRRVPPSAVAVQVPLRHRRIPVVTSAFTRYCHRLGLQLHVWTIDDPAEINRLLDLAVDGIMTDRVDVLRDVYAARGHWRDVRRGG